MLTVNPLLITKYYTLARQGCNNCCLCLNTVLSVWIKLIISISEKFKSSSMYPASYLYILEQCTDKGQKIELFLKLHLPLVRLSILLSVTVDSFTFTH